MRKALPAALVVAALVLGGGYFAATGGTGRYRGGWVEATAVPGAPPNATVVGVSDSSVADSELLVRTVREATRVGTARRSLPSAAASGSVTRALPAEGYYGGPDYEAGWYLRYDDRIVRVNTGQLA